MYDFQTAMADGKARAQRERNRGSSSSAVRVVTTEELYMGMTEDDWNDWQEEQAEGCRCQSGPCVCGYYGVLVGAAVDATAPWDGMDETEEPEKPMSAPKRSKPIHRAQTMTAKQYVTALAKLHLSPYGAAPHLGIGPRMSFRYAAGSHAIPVTVAKLVRALVALGRVDP